MDYIVIMEGVATLAITGIFGWLMLTTAKNNRDLASLHTKLDSVVTQVELADTFSEFKDWVRKELKNNDKN